jgi:hypothetical protein
MTREEFGPTMDAGNVTGHLRRLSAAGVSAAAVAALLDLPGVTAGTLRAISGGEVERVDYRTGAAVLAVMVPTDDRDTSWTADAECRRPYVTSVARSYGLARGVDLFFATPGSGRHECPERLAAVAICGTCRVKDECLAYALAAPGFFPEVGIWGGTTDNERNKLRRKSR